MFARPAFGHWLAVGVAFTTTAVLYAALPGTPVGTADTRVNTTTLLTQNAAAVARDADGDYVVAWVGTTATDSGNIMVQRFNANGVAQGDETTVNTTTSGVQSAPAVALDASGNFVVAWSGNGAQTGQVDTAGIFLQRFDSAGNELGGEIRVNTTTTNTQETPAVAMDADGDFVVVWQSLSQDGSGQGVYAQRYDSAGDAQGSEFQVNTTTASSQRDPSVAMDLDGNFVVAWESNNQDGSLEGVYARVYGADGTAATGEIAVNTTTSGGQTNPAVASRADGEFVVAWTGADADGTGIYARRFDSAGSPIDSSEFAVNSTTTGTQDAVTVARAAQGSFVVAWESNQGGTYDVYARRYDAAGTAGTEGAFAVNATTTGDQRAPAVALDADGDAIVAWQGGTDVDVFARGVVGPEAIDLAVTKVDTADPASAGGLVTYTVTVANLHAAVTPTGDAVVDAAIGSAAGVTVVDTLPSGSGDNVTFVDAQGDGWDCTNSGSTMVTCTLDGVLAPDSEASPIEITVAAPALPPTDRTLVNTVTVSSNQYDAASGNDTDSEDTAVCGAGESPGTVAVSNTSALESVNGAITATRSGGSCGAVSVQVAIGDGTATAPADYTALAPQTLSWDNGESGAKSAANSVPVVNDSVYEAAETVAITLSNPVRATLGANGTFTINDNDPAPSLAIADGSVTEGNSGTAQLPLVVTLTPAPGTTIGRAISVEYDTANGTATTGDGDYTAVVDGVLNFAAGDTTKTINIAVTGDGKDEDDETLTVTLSNENPAAVNITDASATGTITNDDAAPTVQFALATSQVSEAPTNPPINDQAPTLNVQVTLSAVSSRTVTVGLSHAGSTAALPGDYSASPLSLVTFAPGETSKNVTLTIALDALDEHDETVQLTLQNPTNATVGTQATHVATIVDDDALPVLTTSGPASVGEGAASATITIGLAPVSGRAVSVNYALSGTATGGGTDYSASPAPGTVTFAAGETSKTITITPNNDSLDENNETVVVTLSAPQNAALGSPSSHSLPIVDDDNTPTVAFTAADQDVVENVAGGTATATLQLSAISGRDVTVPFTVNGGTSQAGDATNGTDFTMGTTSPVTIPAGSLSATITVNVVNDANNESTENVRLAITTASLVNANAGATTAHAVHITNDDTLPQASFAVAAQSGAEDGGAVTATIQLSRAAEQDITLGYTLSGTALNPGDYTVTPASPVVIAEGESSVVLTLTPVDDDRVEGSETAVVTLSSAINAAILDDAKTHTLTITNDDASGVAIVESGGSTDVVEGGATDSYTLALTSEPATDVTIDVTSTGQTTVTASVTFTPSGPAAWNIPQTITVTAVDDMAGEGAHGDTITHLVSSADADFSGIPVDDVTVSIADDDVPAIILTHTGGGTTATEGGATDGYSVVLSAAPAQDVTVALAHDGQVTLSDTSLTFTATDWDQAQVVTVTAVDDDVAEGTHGTTILHTSDSLDGNFDNLTADLAAQIADDDVAGVVLSKTSATAAEGGAGDSYTLRLSSQPVGDVVVTVMPDAQVSTDASEIVFNAVNWNLAVPVSISAVNDAIDEASPHAGLVEHAVSATGADANYDGIAVADVGVAVTDDDTAPGVSLSLTGSPVAEGGGTATVTATLSAPSGQQVTVNLAFGGVATAGVDYAAAASSITIPAGATTGSTTFTAIDDTTDEADESVTVDIATVVNATEAGTQQVVASITDDDALPTVTLSLTGSPIAENAGVATLTATLSSASSQNVTVTLAYAGTATGADYAGSPSITITAGQLTGTGTITASQDAVDEAAETVVVDIASVSNGTESGTQQVTATIADDDAAPTVTLSASTPTMAETGGTATITATLSAASGQAVTVTLGFGGTATSVADYTASATSITIAAGATTGSITLTSVGDGANEPNETAVVDVTAVTNGTESGTQTQTVTITDDDSGGGGGSWSWLSLWLLLPAVLRRRRLAAA